MKQKTKQTKSREIPEEWDLKPIGEIAKLKKEIVNPKKIGKYPYLGLEHIEEGTLRINSVGSSENIISNKFKFSKGDVLFGKLRPYFRKVYSPNFDGICSTDIWVIIPCKDINNKFLFYFFADKRIIDETICSSEGTRMPRAKWDYLSKLKYFIPNINEQEKIAKILSSLDNKIELNNKLNATLEAIGQLIFKKWFIEDRKDEWKKAKLGDYVESISGCSYTSKGLTPSENTLVTLKSVGVDGFKQDGFKEYTGEYKEKHLVQDGDIVVAHTDLTQNRIILGKPVIVRDFGKYKKMIASMDLSIVKPIKLINKPYLFYLLNSESFHGHAQGYANGTTVIHLSRRAIPEFPFLIPDKELLEKFKLISENLFNQIKTNDLQNNKLSRIRDLILPKLMNGEIRVSI